MVYQRKLGGELYTIALNFSSRKIKLSKKAADFLTGAPLIASTDRIALDGYLLPWEGVLHYGA